MPDLATLEAIQEAFWPLYSLAISAALVRALVDRHMLIARTALALVAGSVAMNLWEGDGYLLAWQHLAINVPILIAITAPPRSYWQSIMGALVVSQIAMNVVWLQVPSLGREHWLAVIMVGYLKCAVLLLWSGGGRVERAFVRLSRWLDDLVRPARRGELA